MIDRSSPDSKITIGSIRLLILLGATLSLLVPFLVLSWINYNVSRDWAKEEIITSALPLTRDNIFSEIHADLIQPLYVSSTMANDSFLKEWAVHGESDAQRIVRYLVDIQDKYGYFSVFYVSANSSRYYHFNGLHKIISKDNTHDDWYYSFLAKEKEYELVVDNDEAGGNALTIFINFRVEGRENSLLGVTGVGVKMDAFSSMLSSTGKKYGRNVFLVDRTGLVQAHADPLQIGHTNIHNVTGLDDISSRILSSLDRSIDLEYEGPQGRVFLTARYIPEFDWFLIVEQAEASALRSARQNFERTIVVGVFLWVVLTALTLMVVQRHYAQLARLARTDNLTGLGNRRHFGSSFELAVYKYARAAEPFCLILIDLDSFKSVNDQLGHLVGDQLLKTLALSMHNALRPTDDIARWGGDEFIVLTACQESEALVVAERLRNAAHQEAMRLSRGDTTDPRASVSISAGVVAFRQGMDLDSLTQHADALLYTCKRAGGNCIACESSGIQQVRKEPDVEQDDSHKA